MSEGKREGVREGEGVEDIGWPPKPLLLPSQSLPGSC